MVVAMSAGVAVVVVMVSSVLLRGWRTPLSVKSNDFTSNGG
jgi:hypothetical protein